MNDLQGVLGDGPIYMCLLYADDYQAYVTTPTELLIEGITLLIIFNCSHRLFDSLDYPGISIADGETIIFVNKLKAWELYLITQFPGSPKSIRLQRELTLPFLSFVSSSLALLKRFE